MTDLVNSYSINDNELALYSSFDEEQSDTCILCGRDIDNVIDYGKKIAVGGVTAHHFCLVRA